MVMDGNYKMHSEIVSCVWNLSTANEEIKKEKGEKKLDF